MIKVWHFLCSNTCVFSLNCIKGIRSVFQSYLNNCRCTVLFALYPYLHWYVFCILLFSSHIYFKNYFWRLMWANNPIGRPLLDGLWCRIKDGLLTLYRLHNRYIPFRLICFSNTWLLMQLFIYGRRCKI